MVYKKYRIKSWKLAVSLILMFMIGFLVAYDLTSFQNHSLINSQTPTGVVTQQVQQTTQVTPEINLNDKSTAATTKIVAVNQNGDGIMGDANVQVVQGNGQVLIDVSPFVEPDTQQSALTAVSVAEQETNTNLNNNDVIVSFNVNGTVVGGPSAGAAMTIASISAIENKPIKQDVVITGTINSDGTIGPVGGLIEKGTAAATNGYKTLLVPKGQLTYTYVQKQTTQRNVGGFTFYTTRNIQKTVNLSDYFKNTGMQVIEVDTIQDAMHYML